MSSGGSRKKLLLNKVSVKLGCGSCTRPKLSHIFNPKPKPKNPTYQKHKLYNNHMNMTSSLYDTTSTTTNTPTPTNTTTTFSPYIDSSNFSDSETQRRVGGFGRAGGEGVAVEKDSEDPYLDFRQSMLQMILENEIYTKEELRELLNCFLQLNSPYHHGVIVRAFTEIWNGVFSDRSSSNSSSQRSHIPRSRNRKQR